jgi:adenylate cyclase
MNDETQQIRAVLYADVSGSTKLYEKVGDEIARSDISICLGVLEGVANEYQGKVLKTIGDEVMCLFPNPVDTALASQEMHRALQEASQSKRFQSGQLRVKIGWHYGPVSWRGDDVIGDAPVTAQQIINMAKAEEILTSSNSIAALPDYLKESSNFVDSVAAEAWNGKLEVHSLAWEEEGDVTVIKSAPAEYTQTHAVLSLSHKDQHVEMDEIRRHVRVGRGSNNELVVKGRFTSRLHAEIIYRHGHFTLYDKSTNGTVVIDNNGNMKNLHREEQLLSGNGVICFGGPPDVDPEAAVKFECHVTTN